MQKRLTACQTKMRDSNPCGCADYAKHLFYAKCIYYLTIFIIVLWVAIEAGAEIVFCTGGMSVDPDDKTPLAIKNTGARIVSYGSPVLPGAMFLLSYYDAGDRLVPICGLPGCAMYNKRTIFDIVLPRLMARDMIYADELAGLGEGGLCLNCDVCTFPNCGFGKGF